MKKDKRFSMRARIVGGLCVVVFIGVLIVFATSGFSIGTGVLLAASLAGIVVPCVSAGDSLLEVLTAMVELIAESIATVVDAILNAIGSLFG